MKQHLEHFIGGRFVPPASGTYVNVFEPATVAVYAVVADGDARDVDAAVEAASFAFPAWSATPTEERARIAASASPHFKKLSLELGGKNPILVFADCDFERAVAESVRATFLNQGQICLCGSRV